MARPDMIYTLLTDPEITNLGSRVFPLFIPQGQLNKGSQTDCAIIYEIMDLMPSEDKYASSKLDRVKVDFTCFGGQYLAIEAVMNVLRERIDHKSPFTSNEVFVQGIHFIDQSEIYDKTGELCGLTHSYIFRIGRD